MTTTLKPTAASRSAAHEALQNVARHQTHEGVVVRYQSHLGFGFIAIAPELQRALGMDAAADLYVNAHQLKHADLTTLIRGQKVSFQVGRNKHGWQAVNVQIADGRTQMEDGDVSPTPNSHLPTPQT